MFGSRLLDFMRRTAVLSAALLCLSAALAADSSVIAAEPDLDSHELVESVSFEGTDGQLAIQTHPGSIYDEASIQEDVRSLYGTGRFSDIRVEATQGVAGKRITFHVVESGRLMLRELRTNPEDFRFKADIAAGTPIDRVRAQAIASEFRRQLTGQGYADTLVDPEIVPAEPGKADLVLHVRTGDRVRVKDVELIGETAIPRKDVLKRLQALRGKQIIPGIPGLWKGFKLSPEYTTLGAASDVARVRSLYLSRGYFDATVRLDHTEIANGKAKANLLLNPGTQYQVRQWQVSGAGIDNRLGIVRGAFRSDDLCRCLFDLRREAEQAGIMDFSVSLAIAPVETSNPSAREVDLFATVTRGQPYRIRRIEFQGNKRFSDSTIRGNLLLDEADLLDSTLLRKSLDRINRSSLFEPLDGRSVDVATDEKTGLADIRIRLKERKFGSWLLSGPVGPMSIAGPLQFTLASRLPAWGQGILELSSWYASFSVMAYADPFAHILGTNPGKKILPIFALQRPFIPAQSWTSGITFAPQLGWKGTLATYGSSQLRERLLPWMSGSQVETALLPVTITRPEGDALMYCEPPQPRLRWLRKGAAVALQFATAVPIF